MSFPPIHGKKRPAERPTEVNGRAPTDSTPPPPNSPTNEEALRRIVTVSRTSFQGGNSPS